MEETNSPINYNTSDGKASASLHAVVLLGLDESEVTGRFL